MLKYIGKGFIPGIPGRDLTDAEVKKYGGVKVLLETGLFEKPKKSKKREYVVGVDWEHKEEKEEGE